jgi:hypothetical protein
LAMRVERPSDSSMAVRRGRDGAEVQKKPRGARALICEFGGRLEVWVWVGAPFESECGV